MPISEDFPTGEASSWTELVARCGHQGGPLMAEQLANLINANPDAIQLSGQMYSVIRQLSLEPGYDPARSAESFARVGNFIVSLRSDLLAAALSSQASLSDRRKVLTALANAASPAAVRALIGAAAVAFDRPLSEPLDALVRKLEKEATTLPAPARAQADATLRSLAHQMFETWTGAAIDIWSTAFEHAFDSGSNLEPAARIAVEPERLVQLGLEAGALGPMLWSAVTALSGDDDLRRLIGMVKAAPAGSRSAASIAEHLANPRLLMLLLREPEVDFDAVEKLVRHLGLAAAEPLLDELINSNSSTTRSGILDRLAGLGPGIGPLIIKRLNDERWFVLRNLLYLLREANCSVGNVPVVNYQNHPDRRVRREALQLLFKDPIARDHAIAQAFKDTDLGIIRSGLAAAESGLPEVAVPVLAKRVVEKDFPPEFRVPALLLLGRSRSVLALTALLNFVSGGTTLLGKPKLAAKSPEMLAALRGLVVNWPQERHSKPLLELAAALEDPEVVAALDYKFDTAKDVANERSE